MGSVFNDTTNTTYELTPDVPLILGRLQVNKGDLRLSRNHGIQITLLGDQRCFVKSMSSNPCILDDAILPKKLTDSGQEEGQEVEAFDGQWIYLLPGKTYPLRLTLPKAMTTPTPRKPLMGHQTETYTYDDSDDSGENGDMAEQRSDSLLHDIDMDQGEEDVSVSGLSSTPSSIVSTESSLIGDESWSD
ncbi:hypothetical protein [Absidia glauca]|uniref:PNK FHA domain-containing protein n=1 Tax=Absidia glauca TaxID=4829 RepID=A0A163JN10_ABSGL|nr:hypothetical protein [Absidia glauca]